jgi:MGT family glycosyltransferase
MSFGTVLGHMSIAVAVLRSALKAVEALDVRVLLTVGRVLDLAALGPVPENVHVEAWVDQGDVLGTADVVVCHGGSGTAFGALAAGVPVVVVPVFADQFENGQRIADARAGVTVDNGERAVGHRRVIGESDAPRIADAIEQVLTVPPYRAAAARIAAEMASVPTVDEVLDELLSAAPGAE